MILKRLLEPSSTVIVSALYSQLQPSLTPAQNINLPSSREFVNSMLLYFFSYRI